MMDSLQYEPRTHVAGVCSVVRTEMITPRMRRITLQGTALAGLERYWRPEMLIRLYFPPRGQSNPPEPFLTSDGELQFRTTKEAEVSPFSAFSEDPLVRAFTARRFRAEKLETDIDFSLHDVPGLAGDWAKGARIGDRLGVVEFALPAGHRPAAAHEADVYLLFADEAAIPAAQTNLESFRPGQKVIAFFEVANRLEEQAIETKADLAVRTYHAVRRCDPRYCRSLQGAASVSGAHASGRPGFQSLSDFARAIGRTSLPPNSGSISGRLRCSKRKKLQRSTRRRTAEEILHPGRRSGSMPGSLDSSGAGRTSMMSIDELTIPRTLLAVCTDSSPSRPHEEAT